MSVSCDISYNSILKEECPISFYSIKELVNKSDKKGLPSIIALIEKADVDEDERKFEVYKARDLTNHFITKNGQDQRDSKSERVGFCDPMTNLTCLKVIYLSNAIPGTWATICEFTPQEGQWRRELLDLPEKYLEACKKENPFSAFLDLMQSIKNKKEQFMWIDAAYRVIPYLQKISNKIDLKKVLDQLEKVQSNLPKTSSAYQKILGCQYAAKYLQNNDKSSEEAKKCIEDLMDISELFLKGSETIEKSPGDAFVGFGHMVALDSTHLAAHIKRACMLQFGYGDIEPDLHKALSAYQHILRLYPENGSARIGIGQILEAGYSYQKWSEEELQYKSIKVDPSLKEALFFYESVLNFDPENCFALQRCVWILVTGLDEVERDYAKALKYIDAILQKESDNIEALAFMAQIYLENKHGIKRNIDLALKCIQSGLDKDSENITLLYWKAISLFLSERTSEGQEIIKENLKKDPNHVGTLLLKGTSMKAGKGALNCFKKVLELNPPCEKLIEAYQGIGSLYLFGDVDVEEDFNEAYRYFKVAYDMNKNFLKTIQLLANNCKDKFHEKSLKLYEVAVKLDPENVFSLIGYAKSLYLYVDHFSEESAINCKKVISSFEKVLKLEKGKTNLNTVLAHAYLAMLYNLDREGWTSNEEKAEKSRKWILNLAKDLCSSKKIFNLEYAFEVFANAHNLDENNIEAQIGLGRIYQKGCQGIPADLKMALMYFLQAFKINKKNIPALIGIGQILQVGCVDTYPDLDKALGYFNAVYNMDKKNLFALIGLGELYLLGGKQFKADVDKAQMYFNAALGVDKKNVEAYFGLGCCCMLRSYLENIQENLLKALGLFENAINIDNKNEKVIKSLSNCYVRLGNYVEGRDVLKANEYYCKALEVDPNSSPAREALSAQATELGIQKFFIKGRSKENLISALGSFEAALSFYPNDLCVLQLLESHYREINDTVKQQECSEKISKISAVDIIKGLARYKKTLKEYEEIN